jgi:cytochrome c553
MNILTRNLLLGTAAVLMVAGCSSAPQKPKEAKNYKYSPEQVYTASCAKCHGKNGEGVVEKKGPAVNDKSIAELKADMFDLKSGGLGGQSSGTQHEVMEHNMKKLIEKGYDYDIDAMANYIYNAFNTSK